LDEDRVSVRFVGYSVFWSYC